MSTAHTCRGLLAAVMLIALTACSSSQPPITPAAPYSAIPSEAAAVKVDVIGDSYTGGSAYGGVGKASWPELVWSRLRAQGIKIDPQRISLGGAGYVHRGQADTTFGEEVPKKISPDAELIVFFGGTNDVGLPIEEIGPAALAAFQAARQIAPQARLIVIGPMRPHPERSQVLLATRDAIRDAATQVGAQFVDPVAEGWLANEPQLIGLDTVHPTDAGHVYLADRIEPLLHDALRQLGAQ